MTFSPATWLYELSRHDGKSGDEHSPDLGYAVAGRIGTPAGLAAETAAGMLQARKKKASNTAPPNLLGI
jgi:hypothetical protein